LKSLPSNSTYIMSPSIIDKYIKRPNSLFNLSYWIFCKSWYGKCQQKRYRSHIILYVPDNEHHNLLFLKIVNDIYIITLLSKATIQHGIMHTTCMRNKLV
jgi:hypothetical protein